jgi:Zn-dependent protease with chaperone function
VALASLGRIASLSSGGSVVAESLGGQLICPNTNDPQQRRILNIVEEMAIASGTPVPPVYLMEEKGINAFAAGNSVNNAVVGITRGCAEKLNREQLQGVVAHEFSHILNGDMRLNIKLTGLIFGIVCLSRIGEILMRAAAFSGGGRRRKKDDGTAALLAIGVGLFVLGLIGGFFGSLIRAAVSRQREFLADASAVQFTRNPDGISGALKRIGGFSAGSKLETASASDFSHMFFGSALSSMFATHPPLEKRIRKIEPNWNASFPETDKISEKIDLQSEKSSGLAGTSSFAGGSSQEAQNPTQVNNHEQIFQGPTSENLEYARALLAGIPSQLLDLCREPFGARCVIFGLLLDSADEEIRKQQVILIRSRLETQTDDLSLRVFTACQTLSCFEKFALIEECASPLRELSPRQLSEFSEVIHGLVTMDQKIDLFEWSLQKVIFHQLALKTDPSNHDPHGSAGISKNINSCLPFLGALAHFGGNQNDAKDSYFQGVSKLDPKFSKDLLPLDSCGIDALENALPRLQKLCASAKRDFLAACIATAQHDQKISEVEFLILRGLASAISCPIGPNLSTV